MNSRMFVRGEQKADTYDKPIYRQLTSISELPTIRPERDETATWASGALLINNLDLLQQTNPLVVANYESDQDVAGVPDFSLQYLDLGADGPPSFSSDETCT